MLRAEVRIGLPAGVEEDEDGLDVMARGDGEEGVEALEEAFGVLLVELVLQEDSHGVHADGLNKFWWMYAPFDVPGLIGRPLEVSLTKDSGIAGLVFVARQRLQKDFDKNSPMIEEAHRWMLRQFDEGRQTAIEWEEIQTFFGPTEV